jgi:ribosomal protein S18 acetylase RimI-like enzyme
MTEADVQIDNLGARQVGPAAAMVGSLPFFADYGHDRGKIEGFFQEALSTGRAELLLATRAGEPVGVAWFVSRGGFDRSGYLRLLAVAENSQRRGVGTRLMQALEEKYLSPGGIMLLVTETNRTARAFYERLGYRTVGSIPNYVRPERTEAIYFKPALPGDQTRTPS